MLVYPESLTTPRPAARLSVRQRRLAQVAGSVGFALIALGLNLAVLVFVFVGAGLLAAGFSDSAYDGTGHIAQQTLQAIVDAYGAPVGATAAGAVVLIVAGFVTSMMILRAGRHVRRRAITWAGAGIACIPNLLAAVVSYFGAWMIAEVVWPGAPVGFDHDLDVIIIAVVLDAVFGAVIGALVWWWMAHVLR